MTHKHLVICDNCKKEYDMMREGKETFISLRYEKHIATKEGYGSKYFDFAWFSYNIFSSMPAKKIFSWHAPRMADSFLRGYVSKSEPNFSKKRFRFIARKMFGLQLKLSWEGMLRRSFMKRIPFIIFRLCIFFYWRSYVNKINFVRNN